LKIWIDVLTPKQAKLFAHMIKRGLYRYRVFVTARDYEYTVAVLRRYGVEPIVVGGYGHDLRSKLVKEVERMKQLLEVVGDFDILIAFPNPAASRIAFGLRRPYIALTDSPHSVAPSRLSLPLADAVVFPSCIPRGEISRFVYPGTLLEAYRGVDEVEWIKDFHPSMEVIKELDLEPWRYIVARPPEYRASYYEHASSVVAEFEQIVKACLEREIAVVYMPRYGDDSLLRKFRGCKGFIVPDPAVGIEGSNVLYYAVAAVTGGGTIAREAALLGTLGISLFPHEMYVDKFIELLGLPHAKVRSAEEAMKLIEQVLEEPKRFKEEAARIVATLETPSDGVSRALKELFER